MPGFELINYQERKEVNKIFSAGGGTLFRHSYHHLRNGCFKVEEFEKKFSKKFNSKYALGVTSGTAALRVAIASLKLKENDEIITQAVTFVATVEASLESGCKPKIVNIDKTLNLDPIELEKKITKKTKAIILVHMLGSPPKIKEILKIAKKYKLYVIEDTAWGCGGKYKSNYFGNIGDIGTFSFDHAKAMTTGEGGMLIFKKKNHYLSAKAWHDHGHENNKKVPRWKDTRRSSGFNYRMNELQGAVGIAQLQKLNKVIKYQRKFSKILQKKLSKFKIEFRFLPKGSNPTNDSFIFITKNKKIAMKCRSVLIKNYIGTKILPEAITWHFAGDWEHIKEIYKFKKKLKKSRKLLERCVSIPIFLNKGYNEANKIVKILSEVLV